MFTDQNLVRSQVPTLHKRTKEINSDTNSLQIPNFTLTNHISTTIVIKGFTKSLLYIITLKKVFSTPSTKLLSYKLFIAQYIEIDQRSLGDHPLLMGLEGHPPMSYVTPGYIKPVLRERNLVNHYKTP